MRRDAPSWFAKRSLRERLLIFGAAISATALFTFHGVFVPLTEARFEGEERYESALTALGQARAAAASGSGGLAARPPLRAPAASILAEAALAAGFNDAQVTASGPASASIAIPAARPQAFFDWLQQLQLRGLEVTTLRVEAVPGGSLRVSASLAGEQ